jgi:hypothetical protein
VIGYLRSEHLQVEDEPHQNADQLPSEEHVEDEPTSCRPDSL